MKKNDCIAHWGFDENEGSLITETLSGSKEIVHYALDKGTFQQKRDPLWKVDQGIVGGCLLFDGYSNYIEYPTPPFLHLSKKTFSISYCTAPRAFELGENGELSAVISWKSGSEKKGFVVGMYRHGRFGFQVGTGREWLNCMEEKALLDKYTWSHITAVFDGVNGSMLLYKNGYPVKAARVPKNSTMAHSYDNPLLIGRNNDSQNVNNFNLNMLNGYLDELSIYNKALSTTEVLAIYNNLTDPYGGELPQIPYKEIGLTPELYTEDIHKPQYHITPPGHWMNEPHAPLYYKGNYHLFFQQNLTGPYWQNIQWGHFISLDMIHWRCVKEALWPGKDSVAPDGVWSGSAIIKEDNTPILVFTAGNFSKPINQAPAIAYPADSNDSELIDWKMGDNLLFEQLPGQGIAGEFRDPFIFKREGMYYILMESGFENRGGMALVYSAKNLESTWSYRGTLMDTSYEQYPYLGLHWELPVLLKIKNDSGIEKDIFLFLPHGEGAKIDIYYFIGQFDLDSARFVPEHQEPRLIDFGEGVFTGPSGFIDPKTGRAILFSITQGQRSPADEFAAGWAHGGGVPLSLYLSPDGDALRFAPIEEIESLREKVLLDLKSVTFGEVNGSIADIAGDMLEIQLTVKNPTTGKFGIAFRQSPSHDEETLLFVDVDASEIYIDTSKSAKTRQGQHKTGGIFHSEGKFMSLRLLLDRSQVEIFGDDSFMLTSRIYPTLSSSMNLSLLGNENIFIETLKIYEMGKL